MTLSQTNPNPSWIPILTESDDLAKPAWDAVFAIAEAIKECSPNIALKQLADVSLLYAYLGLAREDQASFDYAFERLNAVIPNASELKYDLSLYGGLAGLGWVVEHLTTLQVEPDEASGGTEDDAENDLNEEIDAALLSMLRLGSDQSKPYDLVSGLVGFGVYFLERLPHKQAVIGLTLILDHLEARCERQGQTLTWFSGPELLPAGQRAMIPGGYYNLGVAHGIPGVLFLLNEIHAAGVDCQRAAHLLDAGVAWLLAQKRAVPSPSWFNSWEPTPQGSPGTRLAWCYGDLGILLVLQCVLRQTRNPELAEFVDSLLEHCLQHPIDQCGVRDAGLCHGAVGNAHIFNRLYQLTGNERCRQKALQFLSLGLRMRIPVGGVGGFFKFTVPDKKQPPVLEPSPSLLEGAVGVALGFLAALSPIQPQWDRLLLMSGRSWPVGP